MLIHFISPQYVKTIFCEILAIDISDLISSDIAVISYFILIDIYFFLISIYPGLL